MLAQRFICELTNIRIHATSDLRQPCQSYLGSRDDPYNSYLF